jgi:hypothetical protein
MEYAEDIYDTFGIYLNDNMEEREDECRKQYGKILNSKKENEHTYVVGKIKIQTTFKFA